MAKLATLTDAFPGSTLNATNWYVEPDAGTGLPSGPEAVSGGQLSLSGGTYADTGYYTSVNSQNAYDLTASSAFARVVPNTGNSDYDTGFALTSATIVDGYLTGVAGGNFYVQKQASGTFSTLFTVAYSATNHKWIRVSEAGGTITFSTSPDAVTWTSRYTTTTETIGTWTAATSYVQMYYGSVSGAASPSGAGGFQDFNVLPVISGAAALSGTGTLGGTAHKTVPGAAAMSGTGTASGAGHLAGAAALSGTGALGGTGQKKVPGSAPLSGTGTAGGTPGGSRISAAAMSGTGALGASSTPLTPLLQTLRDAFPGSTLSALWTTPQGTVTVAGGQCAMPCTTTYTEIVSASAYSLAGSHALCKLTPDQGVSGVYYECSMFIGDAAEQNGWSFGFEDRGNLLAWQWVGNSTTVIGSPVTYDPVAHAWVRILENSGTIYFDTAPDGVTWTNQFSTSDESPTDISSVYASFFTGYFSGEGGTDGTSYLASFNLPPLGVTMSGSGALTAGAHFPRHAAVAMSGSGSMTGYVPLPFLTAAVPGLALPGSMVPGTPLAQAVSAAAALAGTGTLGGTGHKTVPGAAALSGSGTAGATGTKAIPAAAPLSGSGTTGATGQKKVPGAAALSGSGLAGGASQATRVGAALFAGTGALAGTEHKQVPGAALLSGSGTAGGTATEALLEAAALAGLGILSGSAGGFFPSSASLSGTGSASGTGHKQVPGAAALSGLGTAVVSPQVAYSAAAALSGSGTAAGTGQKIVPGAAVLSGTGAASSAGQKTIPGAAALSGLGTAGGTARKAVPGAAALSGLGALGGTGQKKVPGAAALSGTGSAAGTGTLGVHAAAVLLGSGGLTATATPFILGAAALSGSGSAGGTAHRSVRALAVLAAQSSLHALGVIAKTGTAHLLAPGRFSAAGVIPQRGQAALAAHPVLFASGVNVLGAAALSAGTRLAVLATAGPDLEGLWAAYQQARYRENRAFENWHMMRQAGGTDGTAGFLYAKAYEAERQADLAYKAFQAAQKRVFAGVTG